MGRYCFDRRFIKSPCWIGGSSWRSKCAYQSPRKIYRDTWWLEHFSGISFVQNAIRKRSRSAPPGDCRFSALRASFLESRFVASDRVRACQGVLVFTFCAKFGELFSRWREPAEGQRAQDVQAGRAPGAAQKRPERRNLFVVGASGGPSAQRCGLGPLHSESLVRIQTVLIPRFDERRIVRSPIPFRLSQVPVCADHNESETPCNGRAP